MSSNLPSGGSNQDRLYKDVISSIKVTQYTVNFVIIIIAIGLGFRGFSIDFLLVITGVGVTIVIVSTVSQVFKAIIDLLIRIERNTRSE